LPDPADGDLDDALRRKDPDIARLLRYARGLNLGPEALAPMVIELHAAAAARRVNDGADIDSEHDLVEADSSYINNSGLDVQITYLINELGPSGAKAALAAQAIPQSSPLRLVA
jgi:hypothetical protein